MQFGRRSGEAAISQVDVPNDRLSVSGTSVRTTARSWPLASGALATAILVLAIWLVPFERAPLKSETEEAKFEAKLLASDLRVKIGDSADAVLTAYPGASELKGHSENDDSLWSVAKDDGFVFVFNKSNFQLRTIHVMPSFKGQILGLRIGDPLEKLISELGLPSKKPWDLSVNEPAYLYRKSNNWSVRFDVGNAGPHRRRLDDARVIKEIWVRGRPPDRSVNQ